MLDKKLVDAINEQIGMEYSSAYLYLNISLYYDESGLFGFQKWYQLQAKEECAHAERLITYLQDNDAKVALPAIPAPTQTFTDGIAPAKFAYEQECAITASFVKISKVAKEVEDFRTLDFLNYFHKEQLEEERVASDLLKRLDHFGTDQNGLIYMDKEMGDRV